tara:strand:- start:1 stop:543 length:543 start_codon:yes stop_codon:yes gene_type:complete
MKFNYLIRVIPFLSTLFLIILLSFSNKNKNTSLRILIWDTPSLSLSTYIAISSGSGFLLSFFITRQIAGINRRTINKSIKYKVENNYEQSNEFNYENNSNHYEKTLIERNIKDPTPTINATFRVIGNKKTRNTDLINDNIKYEESLDFEKQEYEQHEKYKNINHEKEFSTDWNDESYSRW